MNAVVAGDPQDVLKRAKAYAATGTDLLLCLANLVQDAARQSHADDRVIGDARDSEVRVTEAFAPAERRTGMRHSPKEAR
jgi:hypothetical protein